MGVKGAVERDTHIRHYIPISFVGFFFFFFFFFVLIQIYSLSVNSVTCQVINMHEQ